MKKKKRVRVVKVTPHVEPDVHEVVLHVEHLEPPPPIPITPLPERFDFSPPTTLPKKRGFWDWLLG
jgi:hypothetical protein